jgi:hypothetical protein
VVVISLDKIIGQLKRSQMASQNSNRDWRASPHEDVLDAQPITKGDSEDSDASVHCSLDESNGEGEGNKFPELVNQHYFSSREAVLTSIPELPANKRMNHNRHSDQVCLTYYRPLKKKADPAPKNLSTPTVKSKKQTPAAICRAKSPKTELSQYAFPSKPNDLKTQFEAT